MARRNCREITSRSHKICEKVGPPLQRVSHASAEKRASGPAEVLLHIDNVHRTFRVGSAEVRALRGINLYIDAGRLHVFKGRSGSGKTTLLNLIGGLDRPTKGRIIYRGRNLADFTQRELTRWRREEVGFIFQAFALVPALTALENVELPLRIAGYSPRKAAERARECLELVGLGKRAHHRSYELSGGEQQRVGIARALAARPRLVIADEPTGELDQATCIKIMNLFRSLIESEGITVCMTTHDPVASSFADITYHLEDGMIQAYGADEGADED